MRANHGNSRWWEPLWRLKFQFAHMPDNLGRLGRSLTLAHAEQLNDAGDNLVRILMKLTSDVERFDSMVVLQRKMLQERSAQADIDDERLSRQSERLRLEAAEIVADAHQALDQLRRLSQDPRTSRSRPDS